MKLKKIYYIIIVLMVFSISGCQNNNSNSSENNTNQMGKKSNNTSEVIKTVKIYIDDKEYLINLEDNQTAKEFVQLLPQEYTMNELNENEKYIYLNEKLSSKPINPNQIESGDVMLYGDNCLVIFYKSFKTSYSYTKIGHIDNLPNLGTGSIKIKLEK